VLLRLIPFVLAGAALIVLKLDFTHAAHATRTK
jgi:hypothetical protein